MLGDINDDHALDLWDPVQILRNMGNPAKYPVYADPDVNSDGSIDLWDPVQILRNMGNPVKYPLYP